VKTGHPGARNWLPGQERIGETEIHRLTVRSQSMMAFRDKGETGDEMTNHHEL